MSFASAFPPEDESARIDALGQDAQQFARASSKNPVTDQMLRSQFNRYWNHAYEQGAIDGFLEGHERNRSESADFSRALRLLAGAIPESMASDNPVLKAALSIARTLLYPEALPELSTADRALAEAAERRAAAEIEIQAPQAMGEDAALGSA